MDNSFKNRIEYSLFFLRVSIFAVMLAWTIDKIINPAHAAGVFGHFYFIEGVEAAVMKGIGVLELGLLLLFLGGLKKRYSYGAVLLLHAVSTFSSWAKYTVELNLLFFAAWPMLAACLALYLLRDLDVRFTIKV